MKKEKLVRFIDKSSLGDAIKAVNWKIISFDKMLKSRGELDSKTFTMDVTLLDFTEIVEDTRIPISSMQRVKSMLSPFGEDIKLTVSKMNDRIVGMSISDQDMESYCCAADPAVIPPVTKDLSDTHIYDVEVPLTEEFVSKFLKSKSALDDVDEFTVKMNKKDQVEIILGYSVANTNRISLIAPTVNGKDKLGRSNAVIKFPTKNLIEVLKANKELDGGILYIKTDGVIKVVYKTDQFQCQYWQFANIKK